MKKPLLTTLCFLAIGSSVPAQAGDYCRMSTSDLKQAKTAADKQFWTLQVRYYCETQAADRVQKYANGLQQLATQGNAAAQSELAGHYLNGLLADGQSLTSAQAGNPNFVAKPADLVLPLDKQKAQHWFDQAAKSSKSQKTR